MTSSAPVAPERSAPEEASPEGTAAPARSRVGLLLRGAAVLVAVVTLVVLGLLHRDDVVSAVRALRAPAPGWLLAAILAEALSMGLYARMQRRLLRGAGTHVPLLRAVSLAYSAHSMSITLPGGPLVSTVYNYRRMRAFGADSTVAAWATALSGLLSSLGLVVLAAGVGVAAATDDTDDVVTVAAIAVFVVLVVAGLAVLRRNPAWRAALRRWSDALLTRVPERYRAHVDSAVAWGGRMLRVRIPLRDLGLAGAHSVGNWIADCGCLALCCLALGVHVPVIPLVLTYVAGMTASSIPIVPGGLGTVDAALTFGLVAAGATASSALAVVVLYRLITFVLMGGIGWGLWLIGRHRRHREVLATT